MVLLDRDRLFKEQFEQAQDSGRLPQALLLVAADETCLQDRCRWLIDRVGRGNDLERDGNLIHLSPAGRMGQIAIEEVRNLRQRLSRSALRPTGRVVWIERADGLQRPAANALLKILEEPPPGTLFLLSSRQPYAILATVRSRCLWWTFRSDRRRPSVEGWEDWLGDFTKFFRRLLAEQDPVLILESYVLLSNFQWILDRQESVATDRQDGRRLLRGALLADLGEVIFSTAMEALPPPGYGRRCFINRLASQMEALDRARRFLDLNGNEAAALEAILLSLLDLAPRS